MAQSKPVALPPVSLSLVALSLSFAFSCSNPCVQRIFIDTMALDVSLLGVSWQPGFTLTAHAMGSQGSGPPRASRQGLPVTYCLAAAAQRKILKPLSLCTFQDSEARTTWITGSDSADPLTHVCSIFVSFKKQKIPCGAFSSYKLGA